MSEEEAIEIINEVKYYTGIYHHQPTHSIVIAGEGLIQLAYDDCYIVTINEDKHTLYELLSIFKLHLELKGIEPNYTRPYKRVSKELQKRVLKRAWEIAEDSPNWIRAVKALLLVAHSYSKYNYAEIPENYEEYTCI